MGSYRFCREIYLTIRAGYLCCLNDPWKDVLTVLNHIINECSYRWLLVCLGGGWVNKYTRVLVGYKWKYREEEDVGFYRNECAPYEKTEESEEALKSVIWFRYEVRIFQCLPRAKDTSVAGLENLPAMEITLRNKSLSLTGYWGRYVGLRSRKVQEASENCPEKPIMICTLRHIL
jgi:hypothetical protein